VLGFLIALRTDINLPKDKFWPNVSIMQDGPSEMPARRPRKAAQLPAEKTRFASWLDSIVPAVIPSDAEFARRVGVDQSYVTRWRRGRRPQVPALVRIAKVTNTSVETLLMIAGYVDEWEGEQ
jgi:transcriptional regulator with XRE-family HTH domain